MKVIFSKYAKLELEDAVYFHDLEFEGLGQRFKEEVKKAAKRISEYPKAWSIYSSNTNISFFHSADEFETIRQQGTQFALIFARISEEFLTSGFEFGERFEVLVVQGFLLEEFPEAFDQIQIRRIGREEYELDA